MLQTQIALGLVAKENRVDDSSNDNRSMASNEALDSTLGSHTSEIRLKKALDLHRGEHSNSSERIHRTSVDEMLCRVPGHIRRTVISLLHFRPRL